MIEPPGFLDSSFAKIRAELGWTPQLPELEEIVADAWAWKQEHTKGYE